MTDRLAGVALFLPVPLVLWLFTRAPFGVAPSLGLGILLTATHRLYARPFALRRAQRRCLWCGAAATESRTLLVEEPLGRTVWRACAGHAAPLARVLGWAGEHSLFLRVGILGTLAAFLMAALLAEAGRAGPIVYADTVALFRLGIALSVLPLGLLAPRFRGAVGSPLAVPFPLHIQALIGTWAVLWLFRLVGVAWLALGALHVAARAGLA